MQSRKAPLYDPWALSKKLGAEFIGVFLFSSVWAFKNEMIKTASSTNSAIPTGFVVGTALAVREVGRAATSMSQNLPSHAALFHS
jgi:hypothetical protein